MGKKWQREDLNLCPQLVFQTYILLINLQTYPHLTSGSSTGPRFESKRFHTGIERSIATAWNYGLLRYNAWTALDAMIEGHEQVPSAQLAS